MFYVHIIDENGNFEIIDGKLRFLYDNLNSDKLIELSDVDYHNYLAYQQYGAKWIDGSFVFDKPEFDLQVQKQQLQQQVWEDIKAKRHAVTRGGVYIKSVDKWFHTDDSSRMQYLALQILSELPEGLRWKTMDNTWIPMTKEILMELTPAIMMQEQKNFEVAERHKVAMEKLKDPLSYDFSTGWAETYMKNGKLSKKLPFKLS